MMHLRNSKFIVSCPARSGSTMLVHLLRSNPALICHGEVYGGDRLGQIAGTYAVRRREEHGFDERLHELAAEDAKRFLYDIIFDAQGRKVCGFKFKTDEAFSEGCRDIQDLICADTDIKIIQLRRRNILDQFISHQVVLKQTGVTLVQREEDRPAVDAFSVEIEDLIAYFEDVLDREGRVASSYPDHRRIMVDYEDLIQDGHQARVKLQQFLGIPVVNLSTTTKKILEDNARLVTNMDEVLEVLRDKMLLDRAGQAGSLLVG